MVAVVPRQRRQGDHRMIIAQHRADRRRDLQWAEPAQHVMSGIDGQAHRFEPDHDINCVIGGGERNIRNIRGILPLNTDASLVGAVDTSQAVE